MKLLFFGPMAFFGEKLEGMFEYFGFHFQILVKVHGHDNIEMAPGVACELDFISLAAGEFRFFTSLRTLDDYGLLETIGYLLIKYNVIDVA